MKTFVKTLEQNLKNEDANIFVVKIHKGKGVLPVEIHTLKGGKPKFGYHDVLMIEQKGCYAVVDPIMNNGEVIL